MSKVRRRLNTALERITGYRLVRRGHGNAPAMLGVVEEFSDTAVTGWVTVPRGTPPTRVALLVDGHEVSVTWATDGMSRKATGEVRSFAFTLRDLWAYCRKRDRLTVRADGATLPIAGHGMYRRPSADGRHTVNELKAKLADGHVFAQTGRLQLSKSLDTEWQRKAMAIYTRVRDVIREAYGYDAILMYGTLLGAIREGGVIGHDIDIDAAYVSRHRTGKAAAAELRDMGLLLIDRGFDVACQLTALLIREPSDPSAKIDLFHTYFDEESRLQFPFGVAGTTEMRQSDWKGTREMDFCGVPSLVPVNSEQLLEHIYGPGWRSPKPGFDWRRDRTKRDMRGVLAVAQGEEIRWSNFYARTQFDEPSSFFGEVNRRADVPGRVLDLGSGEGRDALAFGSSGRTVLGVDRSAVGVRRATARAATLAVDDLVTFTVGDLTDDDAVARHAALLRAESDEPILFYMRFLLHCLNETAQEAVMTGIGECARPGDMLAAEFRSEADEGLPKAFGKAYRRFQSAAAFRSALSERYGFEVIEESRGTGLAPYRNEDPHLYRVIARHC